MPEFPRLIGADEIRVLESERSSDSFEVPPDWKDARFLLLDPHRRYTVCEPVNVPGRSVFGNAPMTIQYLPRETGDMRFGTNGQFTEVRPEHAQNGLHNIALGTRKNCIGICEHTLAARHMGVEADVKLLGARNFPNHNCGVQTELAAVRPYLHDVGPANLMTVRDSVGVDFGGGRYFCLHPDDGRQALVLDHEFSHPKNALGTQRVEYEVEPASLAYISAARTICYSWLLRNALLLSERFRSPHRHILNLTRQNVLLVGDELINPNPAFDDNGRNHEALMHEVIDKIGALALIPGRFVGRAVTRCTSHARDIAALKEISSSGHVVAA